MEYVTIANTALTVISVFGFYRVLLRYLEYRVSRAIPR